MRLTKGQVLRLIQERGEGWSVRTEKNGDGDYGIDEIYSHNGTPVYRIHIPGCRMGVYAETISK